MKNTKTIIILLLAVVALLAFLIGKGSKETEIVYKDRIIEKVVEVEVEVPVETLVEKELIVSDKKEDEYVVNSGMHGSYGGEKVVYSSDMYQRQVAYINAIKEDVDDYSKYAVVDIIGSVGKPNGPENPWLIVNENLKTRNYKITKDTTFTRGLDGVISYSEFISQNKIGNGENFPFYNIWTSQSGKLLMVEIVSAG